MMLCVMLRTQAKLSNVVKGWHRASRGGGNTRKGKTVYTIYSPAQVHHRQTRFGIGLLGHACLSYHCMAIVSKSLTLGKENSFRKAEFRHARFFAAQSPSPDKHASSGATPLMNEYLIAALMRQTQASSAHNAQVRLLIDSPPAVKEKTGDCKPRTISVVVSLSEAIKKSIELDKDLIEIALDHEIPVVKLANIKVLEYKQSKILQKKKSSILPEKEFRFRAGIAENDMTRKVDKMTEALGKGHKCLVQIRCRRRELLVDPQAARTTIQRVLDAVKDVGEPLKAPTIHPEGTSAQLYLQPMSKKKA